MCSKVIKYLNKFFVTLYILTFPYVCQSQIVVNEVLNTTVATDDEFIELFNNSNDCIDMSNWEIQLWHSSAGTSFGTFNGFGRFVFPVGTQIEPMGYLLLTNHEFGNNYSTTPDFLFGNDGIENSAYTIILVNTSGNEQVILVTDGNAGTMAAQDGDDIIPDIIIGPDGGQLPAGFTAMTPGANTYNFLESDPKPAPSATPIASNRIILEPAVLSCNTNVTGANNDDVVVNIPFTNGNACISIVNIGMGTVGGDDPSINTSGIITITGLSEGDLYGLVIDHSGHPGNNANDGTDPNDIYIAGYVDEMECDPCIITNIITQNFSCDSDNTYSFDVCFDFNGTISDEVLIEIADVNYGIFPYPELSGGCIHINTDFIGDGMQNISVEIADKMSSAGPIRITELHYDNTNAGDAGQALEISGIAGTDLANFSLHAYEGSDGLLDASFTLTGTLPDEGFGRGALVFDDSYLTSEFFENGVQDGIALVNDVSGEVIQFISYEGTVVANDGPALGLTSIDIGVAEDNLTSPGTSLQMIDAGWMSSMPNTFGMVNMGLSQAMVCEATASLDETFCCDNFDFVIKPLCDTDTNPFEEGNYFFEIEMIVGGIGSSDINVTVEGATQTYMGTPLLFGPFTHSGTGNQVLDILIEQQGTTCLEIFELPEFLCTDIDNDGQDDNNTALCSCLYNNIDNGPGAGVIISQAEPGTFAFGGTSNSVQLYLLLDGNTGVVTILDMNNTGLFTGLDDGSYFVYVINYSDGSSANIASLSIGDMFVFEDLEFMNDPFAEDCYTTCGPMMYNISCPVVMLSENAMLMACPDMINGNTATFDLTDPTLLEELDLDGDGDGDNTDGDNGFFVSFHTTVNDAENDVNAVTVYTGGSTTLFVRLEDMNGCFDIGELDIFVKESPTVSPLDQSLCQEDLIEVDGNPTDGDAPYTHIWTDLGTGTANNYVLGGANTQILSVNAAGASVGTINLSYQVIDNNGCPSSIEEITITIDDAPDITLHPQDLTIVCPGDPGLFVVEVLEDNVVYQWQVNMGNGWEDIVGETGPELNLHVVIVPMNGFLYRVIVSIDTPGGLVCTVISDEAILNVSGNDSIACIALVNVTLDDNCEANLIVDQFLLGINYEGYYVLNVFDSDGNDLGTTVNFNHINQTLVYTITSLCTGNMCWGNVFIEDKTPPVMDCHCDGPDAQNDPACNFACFEFDQAKHNPFFERPDMIDACGPITTTFEDVISPADCGTSTITRTWLATDESGNSSTCVQNFYFNQLLTTDIQAPAQNVILPCHSGTSPEVVASQYGAISYPHVFDNSGVAVPITPSNDVCQILTTYDDSQTFVCNENCEESVLIIRNWTVLDWCNLEVLNFAQHIKTRDQEAPTVTEWHGETLVSTNNENCAYSGKLPIPFLHDNCSQELDYYIQAPLGIELLDSEGGEAWEVVLLPLGVHTFEYVVFDCCGNENKYTLDIEVVDLTPPVPIITQQILVDVSGVGDVGVAKLFAKDLDLGSHDDCTDVRLEIRREFPSCDYSGNTTYNADGHANDGSTDPNHTLFDSDNGEFVKFCCADVIQATYDIDSDGILDTGYVKVWIRVWDDADGDNDFGLATNEDQDNYNESWAYVKVENKSLPQMICLADVSINCDSDYSIETLGEPKVSNLCGEAEVELINETENLHCGVGNIIRTWQVVGFPQIQCTQKITIENPFPNFDGDDINRLQWPRHYDGSPGQLPALTPETNCEQTLEEPIIVQNICDRVVVSLVSIDTFLNDGESCQKVLRHWEVIDWCQYEANNTPEQGVWRFTQVIKLIDTNRPVLEACEIEMFEVDQMCEFGEIILANAATDMGGCAGDAWLKWQVFVDTWGDGNYDWEYSSFLNPTDNAYPEAFNSDNNGNGIPDQYISPTASGEYVPIQIPEVIEGTMYEHKALWIVTDGCGNVSQCETVFMILDKKAPTPYCINVGTTPMGVNGFAQIWAIDFDLGSIDNCTSPEDLRFTFSSVPPENDPLFDIAKRSSSMIFSAPEDCGLHYIDMYVWDEKGFYDFCTVAVHVTGEACENTAIAEVLGLVVTEGGIPLKGIEMKLNSEILPEVDSDSTSLNGTYMFENVPMHLDYDVTGKKLDDYVNGVTTLDILFIQYHILGLHLLQSPYQLVAADANDNQKITASDISDIRKLILGVYEEFPDNASWRVVDADQALNMYSAFDFRDSISISDLSSNLADLDFVGVKIGDVNGSVDPQGSVQDSEITTRSLGTLNFETESSKLEKGREIEIPIRSSNFNLVSGFQFTITHQDLQLLGIESGSIEIINENYHYFENKDMTTISWNHLEPLNRSNEEVLFTLKFMSNVNGYTRDVIDFSSTITSNQAYIGHNHSVVKTSLWDHQDPIEAFELYQNYPNPFSDKTIIEFNMLRAQRATIRVFDATGKTVFVVDDDFDLGRNIIELDAADFTASGILFFQLVTPGFDSIKKMVVIR